MNDLAPSSPNFFSASDLGPMRRVVEKVFERVTQNPVTKVEMRIDDIETAALATELGHQAAARSLNK